MSEVYVRGYDREMLAGHRYAGNAELNDKLIDIRQSLEVFWLQDASRGVLLVISDKPLGEKKKTFVMRRKEA